MVRSLAWLPARAFIITEFGHGGQVRCYRVRDLRQGTGTHTLPVTKSQFNRDIPAWIKGNDAYKKILAGLTESDVGAFNTRV